jgi:hypothetical protein
MEENKIACFYCKHPLNEHLVNPNTRLITCTRIMVIEAGKYYYCGCVNLNANKELENGKS